MKSRIMENFILKSVTFIIQGDKGEGRVVGYAVDPGSESFLLPTLRGGLSDCRNALYSDDRSIDTAIVTTGLGEFLTQSDWDAAKDKDGNWVWKDVKSLYERCCSS